MFSLFKKLLNLYGNEKKHIIYSVIAGFFHSYFQVVGIFAILYIFNAITDARNGLQPLTGHHILMTSLILLTGLLGRILFKYLAEKNKYFSSYRMGATVRVGMGDVLRQVPMGFFTKSSTGEISTILTTVLKDIETYGIFVFDKMISGLVESLLISIFLIVIDFRLGLTALAGLIVAFLINRKVRQASIRLADRRQTAQAKLADAILEYIQGIAIIKVFGRESQASQKLNQTIIEMEKANINIELGLLKILPFFNYALKFFTALIVLLANYFWLSGSLTLAKTLLLLITSFVVYQGVEVGGNIASILRLFEINIEKVGALKAMPLIENGTCQELPTDVDIVFDHVDFSYEDKRTLKDISFHLPAFSSTAIIGPSGSGKTTICNLIARFWDVDAGQIIIGGHNIKDYDYDYLLSHISMVFQKVYLFEDTVANNIRFGKPEASEQEIIAVAKKARCHSFIEKLPNGYQTVIGEGGSSLSGGEKQRISIARAMLKDAPIVILDEATSSVDPENENQLVAAINELTKNKTKIMIAHRLSTVQDADQILVIEQGQLIQQGNHQQLMSEEGLYRRFIDRRSQALNWQLAT